nr:glycerate kinase [Candidatus Accumulibacter vicinus]
MRGKGENWHGQDRDGRPQTLGADFQTAFGKAPVSVARIAKQFQEPAFCLSGGLDQGADTVLVQRIDAVLSLCDRPIPLEECMHHGSALSEAASSRLCRIIRAASVQIASATHAGVIRQRWRRRMTVVCLTRYDLVAFALRHASLCSCQ